MLSGDRMIRSHFAVVVALAIVVPPALAQNRPALTNSGASSCKQDDSECDIDQEVQRFRKEAANLAARLVAVPDDLSARYKEFLRLPGTGLTKLLPRGKYDFLPKDEGAYYSFSRRTYEYGSASDIELDARGFSVGFAGADYGFFVVIGNVPIESVPAV